MAQNMRVILYTSNQTDAPELRRALTSIPEIRIVAELDEASLLANAIAQFPAELLIVDLDPQPEIVLECLRQLKEASVEVPMFALSQQSEGNIVLRAMRAGVKEFLVKPLNIDELRECLTRITGASPKTKQPGKLISIMGSAGGVGCTTLAVNLAVELAEMVGESQKVALVDLDFRFGHIATLLDVHGQYTVADLCSTPEQLDPEMIQKALIKHSSGVYVLRRPHTFAQAEMITAAHCANVLSSLQEMCAYVVVDGPTRHDPGGRSVLDSADFNLFVLQLLVTCVRNTDRMIQELAGLGFNTDRLQMICNRLGRDSGHLAPDQVEETLKRKFFACICDDWKSVSTSVNLGQPLKTEFERTKVRQDIRRLATKLHCPETCEDVPRGQGLLSKFFRKTNQRSEPVVTAAT
jgi:pilus assembly protein CpaE